MFKIANVRLKIMPKIIIWVSLQSSFDKMGKSYVIYFVELLFEGE